MVAVIVMGGWHPEFSTCSATLAGVFYPELYLAGVSLTRVTHLAVWMAENLDSKRSPIL